ncbi:MAG: glycosyltransferase family 9 protein [Planctomycetaceae bacterium]|nr:hypothetical protein [Planctomycetaceae bacterium]
MKILTIRLIDAWLGLPACLVLTLVRQVRDLFSRFRPAIKPERIAFLKLAEQGAVVVAWPSIHRAVELVGRQNVYFVTFEQSRTIVECLDEIPPSNIITISTGNLREMIKSGLSALKNLRHLGVDTIVDMEFFSCVSASFAYLSGARRRAGLHRSGGVGPRRGNLMTRPVPYSGQLHTWQLFRIILEAAVTDGLCVDPQQAAQWPTPQMPRFSPLPQEIATMQARLSPGARKRPVVLLNPNCSDLLISRQWPQTRYAELARQILACFEDVTVAMTGGREESADVEELVRQVGSDRCISLAGKTTFRELMTAYCLGEVLITNDSGPSHFAALTALDVITLFGPETPQRWSSLGAGGHVIWAKEWCSPCINPLNGRRSRCRDNICMQHISVDEVFQEFCRVYRLRRKAQGEGT